MTIVSHRVESYPSPAGALVLLRVLTKDDMGDHAAYVGIVDDAGTGKFDSEWVAHYGTKLTEREARAFFDFDSYRR